MPESGDGFRLYGTAHPRNTVSNPRKATDGGGAGRAPSASGIRMTRLHCGVLSCSKLVWMKSRSAMTRRSVLRYASGAALSASLSRLPAAASGSAIQFVDVARNAGITFSHANAMSSEKYLIETMGSGCGWIDYDQNGLFDLYLVNSAATQRFKPKQALRGALYRNDGEGGRRGRGPVRHGRGGWGL